MKVRRSVCAWSSILATACGSGGGGSSNGGAPKPVNPAADESSPTRFVDQEETPRVVTSFEEVSVIAGVTGFQAKGSDRCNPFLGSGGAWGDVEIDGDVDLFATNHGGPNFLYLNQGDTTGDAVPDFIESAQSLGIEQTNRRSLSAVFIDNDNDGDQDLYVTNDDGNTLWKNEWQESGSLAFTDVTIFAGLADDGKTGECQKNRVTDPVRLGSSYPTRRSHDVEREAPGLVHS